MQNRALIDTRVTPLLEPGDTLFFHCRTFHAAGANRTQATKFSLVTTSHTADNCPLAGTRSAWLLSIAVCETGTKKAARCAAFALVSASSQCSRRRATNPNRSRPAASIP